MGFVQVENLHRFQAPISSSLERSYFLEEGRERSLGTRLLLLQYVYLSYFLRTRAMLRDIDILIYTYIDIYLY